MADATAVQMPPYSNNSGLYMIPVGTLAALSLILVVLRIYTRRRRVGKLYIDDQLIIVAEVRSGLISMASILLTELDHLHCQCVHCRRSRFYRMGQTRSIPDTKRRQDHLAAELRRANNMAFFFLLNSRLSSCIASTIWSRPPLEVAAIFLDWAADLHFLELPCHSVRPVYPGILKLGERPGCQVLAGPTYH